MTLTIAIGALALGFLLGRIWQAMVNGKRFPH
jgi:hypothetical protein